MSTRVTFLGIVSVATMLVSVGGATAGTIEFLGSGSTGDGPVDAEAVFTVTSPNTLTVTLTDLEPNTGNPWSQGQEVSGISFGVTGVSGSSLTSAMGPLANIASSGTFPAPTTQSLTHWGTGFQGNTTSGTVFLETAGNYAGNGQPQQMIIGPPSTGTESGGGTYSLVGSGNGPGNFNPTVIGSATFNLTIPGLTSCSQIESADVELLFGTSPDFHTGGSMVPSSIPDGTCTGLLLGAALTGLGLFRRKFTA